MLLLIGILFSPTANAAHIPQRPTRCCHVDPRRVGRNKIKTFLLDSNTHCSRRRFVTFHFSTDNFTRTPTRVYYFEQCRLAVKACVKDYDT